MLVLLQCKYMQTQTICAYFQGAHLQMVHETGLLTVEEYIEYQVMLHSEPC